MDATKQGTGDKRMFALPFYSASISCGCFLGMFTYSHKFVSMIMSVHLSACISMAPTGWIVLKFYTGYLYENILRKSKWLKLDKNIGHFT